jgi:hypothetical protein
MQLLVRLDRVHARGDLIVNREVKFPNEDAHMVCRVACARDVEETVSEGVVVRVLDDESEARCVTGWLVRQRRKADLPRRGSWPAGCTSRWSTGAATRSS